MNKTLIVKLGAIVLIVQLLNSSCTEKKRLHTYGNMTIEFYENGNVKNIKTNDSSLHSQTIFFGLQGNVTCIEKKKDSVRDGQTIWYYPTGNIENTAIYKNGRRYGAAFMFYEDGAIKNHRYWIDDKRVGYATDFIQDSIGTLENIYFYDADTIQWHQPASGKGISVKPVNTN